MDKEETNKEIKKFWKTIYQKNENKFEEIRLGSREGYEKSLKNEQIIVEEYTFLLQLQEHIPPEEQFIRPMNTLKITEKK